MNKCQICKPPSMTHGNALGIWKRNGLKRPEMPLDECIVPNAERLLEMEKIKTDLLGACKKAKALIWDGSEHPLHLTDECEICDITNILNRAIAKGERMKNP